MRLDADRPRALCRAPDERDPRVRRSPPASAAGPPGASLLGRRAGRIPEAGRRGDLARPRRRARRHRDPAGGRHLRLLRADARDEDARRLQPRLRDGGRAGRRARRQARARRRGGLRGPGHRPRPGGLDRQAQAHARAVGARPFDPIDRRRGGGPRDPAPALERPLARHARHGHPPEADPGDDRVDDGAAGRRDRRRQEPDQVPARRQRRARAAGLASRRTRTTPSRSPKTSAGRSSSSPSTPRTAGAC